jgi:hypothetical protein
VPGILIVAVEVAGTVDDLRAWRCVLAPQRNTECSRRMLIGDGARLVAYLTRVRRAHAAVLHDDPARAPVVPRIVGQQGINR